MAKYFAFHRLRKPGDKVSETLNKVLPAMTLAMVNSGSSCICLKIWSPLPYGREDYLFGLWKADTLEDVVSTIESFGLLDCFTTDCMRVDEIDWTMLTS